MWVVQENISGSIEQYCKSKQDKLNELGDLVLEQTECGIVNEDLLMD